MAFLQDNRTAALAKQRRVRIRLTAPLAETYHSICGLVQHHVITGLSIPSIGTGIYRFPLELAAQIAVRTLQNYSNMGCSMTFICFDELTLATFHEIISLEA